MDRQEDGETEMVKKNILRAIKIAQYLEKLWIMNKSTMYNFDFYKL